MTFPIITSEGANILGNINPANFHNDDQHRIYFVDGFEIFYKAITVLPFKNSNLIRHQAV